MRVDFNKITDNLLASTVSSSKDTVNDDTTTSKNSLNGSGGAKILSTERKISSNLVIVRSCW